MIIGVSWCCVGGNPVSLMWKRLNSCIPALKMKNSLFHGCLFSSSFFRVKKIENENVNIGFSSRFFSNFLKSSSIVNQNWKFSPKLRRVINRFEGPLVVLSSSALIFGLIIMVSTDRHISAWVGIEVNILGFICLLGVKSVLNMRVLVNYFVFQRFGSTLYLFGSTVVLHCEGLNITLLGYFLVHLGLLCKAGLFPFWVWVPSVVNSRG